MEETELFLHQQEQVLTERKLSQQLLAPIDQRWRCAVAGIGKCNIYASWSNSNSMCGGAWIIRNHRGEAFVTRM